MMVAVKQGGRPRKAGARYPSGKLKPEGPAPAQVKRAFAVIEATCLDPTLSTALGYLRLYRKLTDRQVAAGFEYARVAGRYDRAMGIPRRSAASPSYEQGYFTGRNPIDAPDLDEDAAERAKERFLAAEKVLRSSNPRAWIAVYGVVLEDKVCPDSVLDDLRTGLDLLALHFRG